jgi:hypothetical protein
MCGVICFCGSFLLSLGFYAQCTEEVKMANHPYSYFITFGKCPGYHPQTPKMIRIPPMPRIPQRLTRVILRDRPTRFSPPQPHQPINQYFPARNTPNLISVPPLRPFPNPVNAINEVEAKKYLIVIENSAATSTKIQPKCNQNKPIKNTSSQ